MARGGPREYVFGPRGKFFHLHPPPPPGQEVSPVDETWTLGISIGPPRFFDLFLARGQKYLRSTALRCRARKVCVLYFSNLMFL